MELPETEELSDDFDDSRFEVEPKKKGRHCSVSKFADQAIQELMTITCCTTNVVSLCNHMLYHATVCIKAVLLMIMINV